MIIGITGTLGAGKGTIVDYLVENKGFKHYSVRGFLTEEIKKRNLPVNRDTMTNIANELRRNNTPSYIVEKLYEQASSENKDCIIESLRAPGEVKKLQQQKDFYLFAVDCDIKKRFERIKLRKSSTDNVSFETFQENENREMHSTDPNKQNLSKCIEMADYVFTNDSTIDKLNNEIERVINEIKNN